MKQNKIQYWILLLVLEVSLFASLPTALCQEVGKPFINRYSYKIFGGHPQAFKVVQDSRGILYVANSNGVLTYDGTEWRTTPLANQSPAYTLNISKEDRVYVASFNELGLLEVGNKGDFIYKSLISQLRKVYQEDFEVYRIVVASNGSIYFLPFADVFFEWNGTEFILHNVNIFEQMFPVAQSVVINTDQEGLSFFQEGKILPIGGGERFTEKTIMTVLELPDSTWLIADTDQFYKARLKPDSVSHNEFEYLEHFKTDIDDWVSEYTIMTSKVLSNGNIAVASIGGGVAILSQEGKLIQLLNKTNGLQENYAWDLYEDSQNQLWIALDNGLAKVPVVPRFTFWDETNGLDGYVVAIQRHKDVLYVGTSVGLFYLKNGKFKAIESLKGEECANMLEFTHLDGTKNLIVATTEGVYQLEGEKVKSISKIRPYALFQSKKYPNRLYLAESNLQALEFRDGEWKEFGSLELNITVKSIQEDQKGHLWCGGAPNTIIHVALPYHAPLADATLSFTDSLKAPSSQDGVVIKNYQKHLIFGTGKGFVALHELTGTFKPMSAFGKRYSNGSLGINKFHVAEDGNLWVSVNDSKNQWVEGVMLDTLKKKHTRFSYKTDSLSLIRLFNTYVECIFAESNGIVWFGGPDGLVRYNSKIQHENIAVMPTLIRKVLVNDKTFFSGNYLGENTNTFTTLQTNAFQFKLPYSQHNISFQFSLPSFSNEAVNHYSYILSGYDNEHWSDWTKNTQKEYTNLREGKYIFFVKAKDGLGIEAPAASFEFEILPPWYRAWWAYIAYFLTCLLVVWLGIRMNTQRLQQEKNKLERAVSDRTKIIRKKNTELEIQKEEIVKQSDIVQKANRNIIQKNKEIEQQKEELASQRDALAKQNDEIIQQKDKLQATFENIQLLSDIGREITSHITIGEINNAVYKHVNALMDATGFGIGIYNENMDRLEFPGYIEKGETLPFHTNEMADYRYLPAWAFIHRKEIFINDFENEYSKYVKYRNEYSLGETPKSIIYLPLISKGHALGVITVQSFKKDAYKAYDLNVLKNIAVYAAIALENASVYTQISLKNRKITDSISYAKNIQSAMLPRREDMQDALSDFFLLFKPRDIVSGDFYWFAQTEATPIYEEQHTFEGIQKVFKGVESEKVIVAAIDCTGHGVPGAFMSLLGEVFLNQIVKMQGITSPDIILKHLHEEIRTALHQDTEKSRDGMDAAICVIDRETGTLEFAGAKRPLTYVDEEGLHQIKGDKISIGGAVRNRPREFTKHTLQIKPETTYYIYSDGYQDQFGGEQDTKLREKNLLHLLKSVYQLPLSAQRNALEEFLHDWIAGRNQIDDVLVIGFKP